MNNLFLCQKPIFVCHSKLCDKDSSRAEVTIQKSVHLANDAATQLLQCQVFFSIHRLVCMLIKCERKSLNKLCYLSYFLIFDNKWP